MAQPPTWTQSADFSDYAANHPSQPYNATDHDTELANGRTSVNAIIANLALIQRDDGKLANESVHMDSLSTSVRALLAAGGTVRGAWVTATAYAVGDAVEESGDAYLCATAHTSGTFATDLAAGKWIRFFSGSNALNTHITNPTGAHAGTAISNTPAGGISATTAQAAINELDTKKAPKASPTFTGTVTVPDASVAGAAPNLGQLQEGAHVYAAAGGTADAITATLAPTPDALVDGMEIVIQCAAANTTTTPTLNVNSLGAKTIVKGSNRALVIGDIAGANFFAKLHYDLSLDKWVLLNPAQPDIFNLTEDTSPAPADDFWVMYDASAGTAKKVKPSNLDVRDASQAEMEAASINTKAATPGRLHNHPGVAKCWAFLSVGSGVTASYGYSSITANGVGDYTYNWSRTFSSTNYAAVATAGAQGRQANVSARTTTSTRVLTSNQAFALEDTNTSVVCFGDI